MNYIEIIAAALFFISFYGLIKDNDLIKSIISIAIMEVSVVLFFLGIVFAPGNVPPIGRDLESSAVVDPLPQALVITAIIIGAAVNAINVVMFISVYKQYKITDWNSDESSESSETEETAESQKEESKE